MYSVSKIVSQVVRNNSIKQFVRHKRSFARKNKVIDPGIQKRKNLVEDNQEFEQLNDYDFDLEADFMNVAATHKEYEHEQMLRQEKEKYLIVKQKYFKEKMPNFLTWSDKEQMRYLHNTNPEEWTIEKLSEGFPALPEVVAKILKSTWTKKTENKIRNHDEAVKKNWSLFKEGKLTDLPLDVTEHLQKFTNRDLNLRPFQMPEELGANSSKNMTAPNIKVGTEFAEIIRSYERLKNKNKSDFNISNATNNKSPKPPKEDTYLLHSFDSKQSNRHTTLDHLQDQIQDKAEQGRASSEEKVMLKVLEKEKAYQEQLTVISENVNKLQSTDAVVNAVDNRYATNNKISTSVKKFEEQIDALDYPDRIVIPRNKFKRGYTYKLNDCYYDDDGEFLYRVPGMYK